MKNIILLHGALGDARDLEPLSDALKNLGLNVTSFSFSGHGKTSFQPAFGIEQFAEELDHYIHEHGINDPAVFGYSMGGYVAMQLASTQKQRLTKIITLGTKFNWSKASVEKETKLLDPALMAEKVPAFAKALETKHGENWKELVTRTADMMRQIGEKALLNDGIVRSLEVPVLLGIADKDQMVSLEETTHVFKQLPHASMYMLPGCKHQLETVNTSWLARLIADFVNT